MQCMLITTLYLVCMHHLYSKMAVGKLAAYAGGHTAAAWLVWVDVSLSVVRAPSQPSLPHLSLSAVQLLDYHTPDCESLAATSHMVRERQTQSYGDVCQSERKGERRALVKWQRTEYEGKQCLKCTIHTHKRLLICFSRSIIIFMLYLDIIQDTNKIQNTILDFVEWKMSVCFYVFVFITNVKHTNEHRTDI